MMKKNLLTIILCFIICSLSAQVPNSGFETWAGAEPIDWFTSIANGYDSTIYQSANAYSGTSCVHGRVNLNTNGQMGGPQLSSGTMSNGFLGFPVSQNFDSIRYYVKFNPVGGDQLQVLIGMHDANSGSDLFQEVKYYTSPINSWTQELIKVTYAAGNATNFFIDFSIVDFQGGFDSLHLGSEFYIDDVQLYNTTAGVNEINSATAVSIFPNPLQHDMTIVMPQHIDNVKNVSLYDAYGRLAYTASLSDMVFESNVVRIVLPALANGMYTCIVEENNAHTLYSKVIINQ